MIPRLLTLAALFASAGFGIMAAWLLFRALRSCHVDWTGLIVDDATGKASHSKLGVHAFNAAAIVLMLRICWNAAPNDGVTTLILTIGGLLGASQVASKAIGSKMFGGGQPVGTSTTTVETEREQRGPGEVVKTKSKEETALAAPKPA